MEGLRASGSDTERRTPCSLTGAVGRDAVPRAQRSPWLAVLLCGGVLAITASAHAQVFPARVELRSLFPMAGGDGSAGFVIAGAGEGDALSTIEGAGDINGDGIEDIIVGAIGANDVGEAYLIYGQSAGFPPIVDARQLYPAFGGDGSLGTVLRGTGAGAATGSAVAGVGDVNGDGLDDLLVGADGSGAVGVDGVPGAAYLVFGKAGGLGALVELGRLAPGAGGDGTDGVVFNGIDRADRAGEHVASVGDFNGDGVADFAIGAPFAGEAPGAGESYVIFGRSSGEFPASIDLASLSPGGGGDGSEGVVFVGAQLGEEAGVVGAAGDLNADGLDDLFIGAPGDIAGAEPAVYVVFGSTTSFPPVVELASLDGTDGLRVNGAMPSGNAGVAAAGVGDMNGDGIDDLLIGEPTSGNGWTFLLFGLDGPFEPVIELSSFLPALGGMGERGVVYVGTPGSEAAGIAVAAAGDIDNDGFADMLIGARVADQPGGRDDAGRAYLIYGSNGPLPTAFRLSSLLEQVGGDGTIGFTLNGVDEDDGAGSELAGLGDINGDGIADFAVSTQVRRADPLGRGDAGEAYVLFGRQAP